MTVKRADIAQAIYQKHGGLSRNEAASLVNLIISKIETGLKRDGKVLISGFGTFEAVKRKARRIKAPGTQNFVIAPEHKTVVFEPSKKLIKLVREGSR